MTSEGDFRIERDTMGEVKVPARALWKAQTQRAVENFPISGVPIDPALIAALGLIKGAAAQTNARLGRADRRIAQRRSIRPPRPWPRMTMTREFPIDVFQTGSGTSSNMNANEVIAALAGEIMGETVHPNDHVNASQSSNDVFPSAIHIAATQSLINTLIPALQHLEEALAAKATGVRRGGEERPDPPDGRDTGDAGAGVRRLRGADPLRHRAGASRPSPGSPNCRSAARPSAPASTPRPASPRR